TKATVVAGIKTISRLVEVSWCATCFRVPRRHPRASAEQVDDPRGRPHQHLVAGLSHTLAVIGVLEVHEVAVVEKSDAIDHLAADDDTGKTEPGNISGLVGIGQR